MQFDPPSQVAAQGSLDNVAAMDAIVIQDHVQAPRLRVKTNKLALIVALVRFSLFG